MRLIPEISIVVCSPSDVNQERGVIRDVVAELERTVAQPAGVRLNLLQWETDAMPGLHARGPQGLIDPVLRIPDADIFIGILWKRIGTAAANSLTGTEHEFEQALNSWKQKHSPQILFYFCSRPSGATTRDDLAQAARVLDFKERFPKEGLPWNYATVKEFEKLARVHVAQAVHAVIQKHELDARHDQAAIEKIMYVKVLHLSDSSAAGGAGPEPVYQRMIGRVGPPAVAVFDEALFLHLTVFLREQSRLDFSFRSTGAIDARQILPFVRNFPADGAEVALARNIFNPSVLEPSSVYFGANHHINGLQRGNETLGMRMDRFTRHARLLVDFSSVPRWRAWLTGVPKGVHRAGDVERPLPVEELSEGLFTCSMTDLAAGQVIRMDLPVDWERFNDSDAGRSNV